MEVLDPWERMVRISIDKLEVEYSITAYFGDNSQILLRKSGGGAVHDNIRTFRRQCENLEGFDSTKRDQRSAGEYSGSEKTEAVPETWVNVH